MFDKPHLSSSTHIGRSVPNRRSLNTILAQIQGDRFDLRFCKNAEGRGATWVSGGQAPCETLQQALENSGMDQNSLNVGVVTFADSDADWDAVAHALYHSGLQNVSVEFSSELPNVGSAKRLLEQALFKQGFAKHPEYYRLCGYEALNDQSSDRYGLYIRLPESEVSTYPLSFLLERRELHMDMTREHGDRSDAHVIRYVFGAEEIPVQSKRILDACCGYGYGSSLIAYFHPGAAVVGVDIDEKAIDYAKTLYGSNVAFHCADMLSFLKQQPSNSYDAVCMFEGMEHIEDIGLVLGEVNRILTDEGRIVVSVPNHWVNEEGIDPNPHHVEVYDWENFRSVMSENFALDSCYAQIATRLNKQGKWIPEKRSFNEVDARQKIGQPAEWWLASARKRAVPLANIGRLDDVSSSKLEELLEKVRDPKFKAISFDVFDTLLVRPTQLPEDVFMLLENQLVAERGQKFVGFSALRIQAEVETRTAFNRKGVEDILLTEIYSQLRSYLCISEEEAVSILERELQLEEQLLRVRHSAKRVFDAAREAGKRVIVASDIYLDEGQLARLLNVKGFGDYDDLYVSGSLRAQKRRGTLFQKMLSDLAVYGISADCIFHLGDNKFSDVERAKEHGLDACHFIKTIDAYTGGQHCWPGGPSIQKAREADFGLRSFEAAVINKIFDDPFRRFENGSVFDHNPFFYGATRLAPFVMFSMKSFLERCQEMKVSQVFFVTRDGHLPRKVFEILLKHSNADIEVKDLHISRKVMQIMDVTSLEDAQRILPKMLSRGANVSLDKFISLLAGFPACSFVKGDDVPELAAIQRKITWENLEDARSYLAKMWADIAPHLKDQQERIRGYIDDCFCETPAQKSAIWDVGYFHTVAQYLEVLGHLPALSGHVVEISHHSHRKAAQNLGFSTQCYVGRINNTLDSSFFDTGRHSVFLELLLSDPSTASRLHFTANNAPLILTENDELRCKNMKDLSEIHDGVVSAVEAVTDWYGGHIANMACSAQRALEMAFAPKVMAELSRSCDLVFENDRILSLASLVSESR